MYFTISQQFQVHFLIGIQRLLMFKLNTMEETKDRMDSHND